MTLSEELTWRGFVNQTTFKDITAIDGAPITFYWGVDPSAVSLTIGNLAAAMMVKHFMKHGHKAVLLIGGATGLIGDPDGKSEERSLKSLDEIAKNKAALASQYKQLFGERGFEVVDNYDWFKEMGYLQFLRDIGKHVPMRQMLGREFVQTRLGESGSGISYAEFSYVLIQGYDFLHLFREKDVTLQVCGADQWGNSVAGVELIRRIEGKEAHVWSTPLVINKATGKKFGKTEDGAVWLDPSLTSPEQFYQFWINVDDDGVLDYLKIYTELSKEEVEQVMDEFNQNRAGRAAQKKLAWEVTKLVHGEAAAAQAQSYAEQLRVTATDAPADKLKVRSGASLIDVLYDAGLAASKTEARQLLASGGIYINDTQVSKDALEDTDFQDGTLRLRRGKKLQNTKTIELQQ